MDKYYLNRPSKDTPPSLGIVLDNEISGRNITIQINKKKTEIEYKKFTKNQVIDNVLGCAEIIKSRDGITPKNYTYPYFFWDYMSGNKAINELGLWLAHFKTEIPGQLGRKNIFDMLDMPRENIFMWQALADGDNQGEYFGSGAEGLDVNFFMHGDGTYQDFLSYYNLVDEDAPEPQIPVPPVDCTEAVQASYELGKRDGITQAIEAIQKL